MSQEPVAARTPRSGASKAGQISRAWLGTFATSGVNLAIAMLTGILAARLLLPEGRGAVAAITFWPGLFWSIGLLSLGDSVTYRISKCEASEQPTVATTGLALALAAALLIAAATATLMPYLLGPEREAFWPLGQLFALTHVLLWTIASALLALDQGRLHFRRYNILRLVSPLTYLCGLIVLWALDQISVTTALVALWIGTFTTVIVRTAGKTRDLRARPLLAEARRLLDLYFRFQATSIVFLIRKHLDMLLLMSFWDDRAIGLYMVALSWASAGIETVTMSFSSVMFPFISAEANPDRGRALLARSLRYACLLLAVAAAALILVTPWLLPLLFGASFRDAVPLALILLGASLPRAINRMITRGLRGLGEARPGTIAEVVAITVFLACAWPLTRMFDLLGVGATLLLAHLAALVYLSSYLHRRFGLGPASWWGVDRRTLREVSVLGLEQLRSLWHRYFGGR